MVAMEPFNYRLFPTFFALLDDYVNKIFTESDTSTDRIWAAQIRVGSAQIESVTVMHRVYCV